MKVSKVNDDEILSNMDFNLDSKLSNLRAAKNLANEITELGAKLFDSLGKEKSQGHREARLKSIEFLDSISKNLNSNSEQEYIERNIRDLMGNQEG